MALTQDATASVNTGAIASATPNWSHTCTGSDNILYVLISWTDATGRTITSVTYGSATLSLVNGSFNTSGNSHTAIYRTAAPASGAATVQVNFSGTTNCIAYSVSFTACEETPGDSTNATISNNAPSVTVATLEDNDYVIDILMGLSTFTLTAGGSQTLTLAETTCSGGGFHTAGSRLTNLKSPAGSVTMSWTLSNTEQWLQSAVVVQGTSGQPSAKSNALRPHAFSPGIAR